MREIDTKAIAAAHDASKLSDFITEHDLFITRTASKVAKRILQRQRRILHCSDRFFGSGSKI
jgi:uncharacterized protein (DUF1778 family)